jgi:hypothetical protein
VRPCWLTTLAKCAGRSSRVEDGPESIVGVAGRPTHARVEIAAWAGPLHLDGSGPRIWDAVEKGTRGGTEKGQATWAFVT